MKNLLLALSILISIQLLADTAKADRTIKVVNYETEGVKQWLPGTIVVMEGETIELQLINNAPSGIHGFEIADFKIKENVAKGKTSTVVFKTGNAGIYPINCHLHPAHVGGQLVILKK